MRVAALLLSAAVASGAETVIGPTPLMPVVSVYVVGDGRPCQARAVIKQVANRPPSPLLVRAFDPADKLLLWHCVEYVPAAEIPAQGYTEGIELRDLATPPQPNEVILDRTVTLPGQGVSQLRLVSGHHTAVAEVHLERELGYGVSFQNGPYHTWRPGPAAAYAFVPPHAEELTINGGPVTVFDQAGAKLAEAKTGGSVTVPVKATGAVWRFELPADWTWKYTAAGFPLILCPTPEAARAIHASIDLLPDGTAISHAFQRRIAALLPKLLAPERVGRAEDLIVPLADRREAWLADPLRNVILKDSYLPMVETWLRSQNVDPTSHWGGSLNGWQKLIDQPPPGNRWDRLRGVDGLWGGASSNDSAATEQLVLACRLDEPTNPYHGRRELVNRAAAACLRDLMTVTEDERFPGTGELDPYPGMMAFVLGQKTLPAFADGAALVEPEVREVWTEGLRRLVDRVFCDYLTSARNQSSHYLVAFQCYANGSGDPLYRDLARIFARRWIRGQSPAGYHMEATGPCGSYIGMTHWHEAVYYRLSRDPAILESLRRSYRFFNHTVAPEPDGRMLGGFNFNHRVGDGFFLEQWSGARGILDDALPEVGLWAGPKPSDEAQQVKVDEAKATIEKFLADPKPPLYASITTSRYLYFAEPDRSATWPACEPGPFARDFAGELLAVKRPAYYAVVFTGQPAAGEFYLANKEKLRRPFANDAESTGGELPEVRKITPLVGGGLSGFWTPAYGQSLMAANWAPTTHHGLTATKPDGLRYWEQYHGHQHA